MNKLIKWMWVLITIMWVSLLVSLIVEPYSITAYWVFSGINWACILSVATLIIVGLVQLKIEEKRLEENFIKMEIEFKERKEALLSILKEREMEYNNLEILTALWYGKLGIIKARDKTINETKIYIGEGEGLDEKTDIYRIVSFGTKYTPENFEQLVDLLKVSNSQN